MAISRIQSKTVARRQFGVWWRRRGWAGALFRIGTLCAAIAGLGALAYLCWTPGLSVDDGRFNRGRNGIWIGHGWLGDDGWFSRNPQRVVADFRSAAARQALVRRLAAADIRCLYAHLCPAQPDGTLPPYDAEQLEALLDDCAAGNLELFVWIGGVNGESAHPALPRWRSRFVQSVRALLAAHPRLAGVQLNIEPLPDGDPDFLTLLEELRAALPPGGKLGVAGYPPPSWWHPFPEVHWSDAYLREVAERCDQLAVMMYDTALTDRKFYTALMADWTEEILLATRGAGAEILLGVPAYDDAGSGYHHPEVEALRPALRGIQAGLARRELPPEYGGLAIYCEWEMEPSEWRIWDGEFLGRR